jgi:hypothetical protein
MVRTIAKRPQPWLPDNGARGRCPTVGAEKSRQPVIAFRNLAVYLIAFLCLDAAGLYAGESVHPGTAILDEMGIYAGEPVHPGTAILDAAGIYAGKLVTTCQ